VNRVGKCLVVLMASAGLMLASAGSASADLLYGANGAGNRPADLLILDPASGAVIRTVGPIGFGVTGLAIDPGTGTLYGVTGLNSNPGTAPDFGSLITINRTTGAGTLVGKEVPGTSTRGTVDITFTPGGTLFGWFETTDDLAKIDKSTGVATVIGDSGVSTYGGGFASNAAGTLFLAGEGEQGPLRTVDPNTGLTTQVATLNGPSPDPGISALAFDSSGKLYGSTTPSNSGTLGSTLISIDPASGALTTIGAAIDRLDALVFVPGRSVTLKKKLKNGGEKVQLFGQIADTGDPACLAGQSVQVQRLRLGAAKTAKKKKKKFKTFKKVQTNSAGKFSTKAKVNQSFKYRAFLPESNVCDDATSKPKKVKA
jgi:hypothetical protein